MRAGHVSLLFGLVVTAVVACGPAPTVPAAATLGGSPAPAVSSIPTPASALPASFAPAPATLAPATLAPATLAPPTTTADGARIIADAFGMWGFSWSPGRRYLAFTLSASASQPGRTFIVDPDGSLVASAAGDLAAWIDDGHILTSQVPGTDLERTSQLTWVTTIPGGSSEPYLGTPRAQGLVGNGHGAVAIASADDGRWAILANGTVEAVPAGLEPVAWSADGTLMAAIRAPEADASASQVRLASISSGAPVPGRLVVVRYPGWAPVFDSRTASVDAQSWISFSPDGTRIAGRGVVDMVSAIVFDLRTSQSMVLPDSVVEWRADGSLVLVGDAGRSSLLAADGSRRATGLPAGSPIFGPTGGVAILRPDTSDAFGGVRITRNGASRTFANLLVSGEATWTADGSALFVVDSSLDTTDRVLRLPAP